MIKTIKTKQFKITALVLAAVLALTCVFWNPTEAHALELQSANIQTFANARAITDSQLVGTAENPVKIGVFITGATNSRYDYDNVDFTHNGTSWSGGGMLYEGSGSTQMISAYYPYKEDVSDNGFTVYASDQIDYMCATPTKLTSAAVTLTMKHVMAKIVLAPTLGTEVNSNDAIANIEVGGMYASGMWTVSTNTWSGETGSITLEMTDDDSDGTYEVLVIPMDNCAYFPVTVTMESGRVFKTTVSLGDGGALASGTQYTISLQVGQDVVALDEITAASWSSVSGGSLGTE